MANANRIIEKLIHQEPVTDAQLCELIEAGQDDRLLFLAADAVRRQVYHTDVYIRGLIEFTNYCRNNCYYCGIRRDNGRLVRYRLSAEEMMACCHQGYALGFRTFVLQGGEDMAYSDADICEIVSEIHTAYPDCAITLSIGEKKRESYQAYFDAGATRYLLRHETATAHLYRSWHPEEMSLENRRRCLFDLKEIGYQVGAGFMVGAPGQTAKDLVRDLRFLQELSPDMVGIGPFVSHADTPFAKCQNGTVELTCRMLAILRLLFPHALLPATTALGTIHPQGRELGLRAGANVVMPNLSPKAVRKQYALYDNKICTGEEAAECLTCLKQRVEQVGYHIVTARGDCIRP